MRYNSSGFFTANSKALSLAELQSRVPAGYMRFMAEATDLLKASGSKAAAILQMNFLRWVILCFLAVMHMQ